MTATKKEIELWRLKRFESFIPDFPIGEVEATEEPDFLVRGDSRVVGIELTDLHRATNPGQMPRQATEAMRKRVITRAQEIYTALNHPPVIATFFLDDRVHIQKTEVEPLAAKLANLVASNLPASNSTAEVPKDWDDFQERPQIMHSLSVHRLDAVTRTFFSSPGATWVAPLTREDIERALSSKDPKHPVYRAKCDEAWLVINVDIESMATWFEFDLSLLREPFTTSFERVFLVQHFGGKAHELSIHSGGA